MFSKFVAIALRFNDLLYEQARRLDTVTGGGGGGGGRNKFWEGTRSLFMWIPEGHRGKRNLFSCGSNEQDKDQKNKVFCSKIFTNSGYLLKILAIFHEFLSEDQKKKVFVPKL